MWVGKSIDVVINSAQSCPSARPIRTCISTWGRTLLIKDVSRQLWSGLHLDIYEKEGGVGACSPTRILRLLLVHSHGRRVGSLKLQLVGVGGRLPSPPPLNEALHVRV